jgi:hypothetical protein
LKIQFRYGEIIMSEQTPNPASFPEANPASPPGASSPPPYRDWREQRRAERMARREARRQMFAGYHYGWFGGAILVLLGVIFLLQNLGYQVLTNWWALFILIPAYWSYVGAWNIFHANGRMTQAAASSLTVGVLLTVLTFIFLINLAFGALWPILFIVGGLLLLASAFFPR